MYLSTDPCIFQPIHVSFKQPKSINLLTLQSISKSIVFIYIYKTNLVLFLSKSLSYYLISFLSVSFFMTSITRKYWIQRLKKGNEMHRFRPCPKFVKVYMFLETGTFGRFQLLTFLGFSLYPLSVYLNSSFKEYRWTNNENCRGTIKEWLQENGQKKFRTIVSEVHLLSIPS